MGIDVCQGYTLKYGESGPMTVDRNDFTNPAAES